MAEILKGIWPKLLYAWTLPSAVWLGITWLVIVPRMTGGPLTVDLLSKDGVFFGVIAILISIALSSVRTLLYRILEGYSWPRALREWGVEHQLRKKRETSGNVRGAGWVLNLTHESAARYPVDDGQVVPSKFGNAIRSFETYGKNRFNLDSQTLWHELIAVSPKYVQAEIDSGRTSVDFFVTCVYFALMFTIACIIVIVSRCFTAAMLLSIVVSLCFAWLSLWFAIQATDDWGDPVRSLVNLGRLPLAKKLGLELPATLDQEKEMWGHVTKFFFLGVVDQGVALDKFRAKEKAHRNEEAEEEEEADEEEEGEGEEEGGGEEEEEEEEEER
jgi:hypothetical protein